MKVERADIFFCQSVSNLGKLIQWFSGGEVNHTGIIAADTELEKSFSIEALYRGVSYHPFYKFYSGKPISIEIWRPININEHNKNIIVASARRDVGEHYGYFDLGMQFLDVITGNHYFFRRLGKIGKWSICSTKVIQWYNEAGYDFGFEAHEGQPDDIRKFCQTHKEYYTKVRELKLL